MAEALDVEAEELVLDPGYSQLSAGEYKDGGVGGVNTHSEKIQTLESLPRNHGYQFHLAEKRHLHWREPWL